MRDMSADFLPGTDGAGPVRLAAGPRTDVFIDPGTGEATLNAVRQVGPAGEGDFQLSVRVEVSFAETFDAGALLVWGGDETWAKLALEFSPEHQPMVVSVVTRGRSDDANGVRVAEPWIWLRVSRIGSAYAFHSSLDGQQWDMVRHFEIGPVDGHLVGLEVQSPLGDGCAAVFEQISWTTDTLEDLRSGL
jgi:uncharacterized protein